MHTCIMSGPVSVREKIRNINKVWPWRGTVYGFGLDFTTERIGDLLSTGHEQNGHATDD